MSLLPSIGLITKITIDTPKNFKTGKVSIKGIMKASTLKREYRVTNVTNYDHLVEYYILRWVSCSIAMVMLAVVEAA
jgi:hypothetical protein